MSALQQFIFPVTEEAVRVQTIDSDCWFHLSDLCKILGLTNPSELASQLESACKEQFSVNLPGSKPWFVDEEALYTIVLRCPDSLIPDTVAYKFRKWVIGVIKNIRKTGSYTASEADQKHFSPFGLKINLQGAVDAHSKALEGSNASLIAETRRSLDMLYKMQQSDQGQKPKSAPSGSPLELNQKILTRIQNLNTAGTPATVRKILQGKHFQKNKTSTDTLRNALQILTTTGKVTFEEETKAYTVVTPSEAH